MITLLIIYKEIWTKAFDVVSLYEVGKCLSEGLVEIEPNLVCLGFKKMGRL